MAFNFQDLLQRITAVANQPPLSLQDVQAREMEAFNELHVGNVEAAARLYAQLINQLEVQLSRPERGTSADGEGIQEDREALEQKLSQLKDHLFALQLTHELNPEFNFTDAALANRAFQVGGLFDGEEVSTEDRVEREKERLLEHNEKRVQFFWRVAVPIYLVLLGLTIFLTWELTDPCTTNMIIILSSFLAFLPLNFFVIALIQRRLNEIDGNIDRLDHITPTDIQHSLWPRDSFAYRVARGVELVTFFGKIAWIIAALVILTRTPEDCNDGILDSVLYIVVFFGNLSEWATIGILLTALAILILCCPCVSYIGIYIYNEYQKQKPVGMRKNELKKLPETRFKHGMVKGEEEPICVVCQTEFEDGEMVRRLPCEGQHTFHKECVDTWLKRNDTCPLCKTHFGKRRKNNSEDEVYA